MRHAALGTLTLLFACSAEHVVGTRGFLAAKIYPGVPADGRAVAVAAADFDGDGKSDVIALDGVLPRLCRFAASADGSLGPANCQTIAELGGASLLGTSSPSELVAAGSKLTVLRDFTFAVADTTPLAVTPATLLTSDVSGDGVAEVLLADANAAAVWVWPLSQSGRLGSPFLYEWKSPARAMFYEDIDGDGQKELGTVAADTVTVYRERGSFITNCPTSFADPAAAQTLRVADKNQLALFVADRARGGLLALAGKGGGFDCGDGVLRESLTAPAAMLRADFDGDGESDLLAIGEAAVLLFGDQEPAADKAPRYALPAPAISGAVADLDGDGRPDVVLALSDGNIAVLWNSFLPR